MRRLFGQPKRFGHFRARLHEPAAQGQIIIRNRLEPRVRLVVVNLRRRTQRQATLAMAITALGNRFDEFRALLQIWIRPILRESPDPRCISNADKNDAPATPRRSPNAYTAASPQSGCYSNHRSSAPSSPALQKKRRVQSRQAARVSHSQSKKFRPSSSRFPL